MCAVFVCFSLSLLSGLSHQDYSSILLSFPNTIAKGCVLSFSSPHPPHPPAFSVPPNQQLLYHSRCPLRQRLRKLLVVTSVPCSSDNCWDVWSSPLSLFFLSLSPFLSLTPVSSTIFRHRYDSFSHLTLKKKKRSHHVCEIFSCEEVTRTFIPLSNSHL